MLCLFNYIIFKIMGQKETVIHFIPKNEEKKEVFPTVYIPTKCRL